MTPRAGVVRSAPLQPQCVFGQHLVKHRFVCIFSTGNAAKPLVLEARGLRNQVFYEGLGAAEPWF